jgi:hypothetical protein
MEAATSNSALNEAKPPELAAEVETVETRLRQRVPVGHSTTESVLVEDFVRQGLSDHAVRRAIMIMMQREELEYRQRRRMIYRKR